MKEVIIEDILPDVVYLDEVNKFVPIFAKDENGFIKGMLIKETDGWIVRTGGDVGATGHHGSRSKCLQSCKHFGWKFFIDDKETR